MGLEGGEKGHDNPSGRTKPHALLPIVEAESTMLALPYRSNFSMLSPFSQSDSN